MLLSSAVLGAMSGQQCAMSGHLCSRLSAGQPMHSLGVRKLSFFWQKLNFSAEASSHK